MLVMLLSLTIFIHLIINRNIKCKWFHFRLDPSSFNLKLHPHTFFHPSREYLHPIYELVFRND